MRIFFSNGEKAGACLDLIPDGSGIGRETDNQICILEDGVSRHHARIERIGATWFVEDLGTVNGTYLDGRKIRGRTPIRPGDELSIGTYKFRFDDDKPSGRFKKNRVIHPRLRGLAGINPSSEKLPSTFPRHTTVSASKSSSAGKQIAVIAALAVVFSISWLSIRMASSKGRSSIESMTEPSQEACGVKAANPLAEQPGGSGGAEAGNGALSVESVPSGSSVFVDGEHRGVTPFACELPSGDYRIKIESLGCAPVEEFVSVRKGEKKQLKAELKLKNAKLAVKTDPAQAQILIDGTERGRTPSELELEPGRHEVVLLMDGFPPIRRKIEMDPGETYVVEEAFETGTGGIDLLVSPMSALVYLDGKEYDRSSPSGEKGSFKVLEIRDLPPGNHVITVVHDESKPKRRALTIPVEKGRIAKPSPISMWTPDTLLELKDGSTKKGRLCRKDGSRIVFEPEPNVKIEYAINDIRIIPLDRVK